MRSHNEPNLCDILLILISKQATKFSVHLLQHWTGLQLNSIPIVKRKWMLIKGGFCLAEGSDGRGRCIFTLVAFIFNLVPSTTGSSEQPSLKPPQLLLQWMAASPQELFAIDTSIQAHHRAVSISSPNSSPRPSKSTPARLRLLLTTLFSWWS